MIAARQWFFQGRPRTYGIIYLVGIGLFGGIYSFATWLNPEAFYSPYAAYDPDLSADRQALTPALQNAILHAYQEAVLKQYPDGVPQGGPSYENLFLAIAASGQQPAYAINWLGPSPHPRGRAKYLWPLVTITVQRFLPAPPGGKSLIRISADLGPPVRSDVARIRSRFVELLFGDARELDLPLDDDARDKVQNVLLGSQGRTASSRTMRYG